MIDKLLGHYRIITKLGEGGMGVVYRAHDEVLQRDVAIKVVGEALAAEARSVLLREARAASALNHPNICIVHEVNETDGATGGTLFYMSPEVLRGEPGDHRSDLWALGVLLFEAAAGEAPFQGRTAFELNSKIMSEPPPTLAGSIPSGLAAIIQRCLAKEPAQRYQRASEVQAALEAVQSAAVIGTEASTLPLGRHVKHALGHLSAVQ